MPAARVPSYRLTRLWSSLQTGGGPVISKGSRPPKPTPGVSATSRETRQECPTISRPPVRHSLAFPVIGPVRWAGCASIYAGLPSNRIGNIHVRLEKKVTAHPQRIPNRTAWGWENPVVPRRGRSSPRPAGFPRPKPLRNRTFDDDAAALGDYRKSAGDEPRAEERPFVRPRKQSLL